MPVRVRSMEGLARIFHERGTGWVCGADRAVLRRLRCAIEVIAALGRDDRSVWLAVTPTPAWDAGRFDVNARARHWMDF